MVAALTETQRAALNALARISPASIAGRADLSMLAVRPRA